MGRPVGFEPTRAGATIRCANRFATIAIFKVLAGVAGLEPTLTVLETAVLPIELYPYKWWRGADSNCRTRWERIYSPPRLATSLPLHIVYGSYKIIHHLNLKMPARGLEPPTY